MNLFIIVIIIILLLVIYTLWKSNRKSLQEDFFAIMRVEEPKKGFFNSLFGGYNYEDSQNVIFKGDINRRKIKSLSDRKDSACFFNESDQINDDIYSAIVDTKNDVENNVQTRINILNRLNDQAIRGNERLDEIAKNPKLQNFESNVKNSYSLAKEETQKIYNKANTLYDTGFSYLSLDAKAFYESITSIIINSLTTALGTNLNLDNVVSDNFSRNESEIQKNLIKIVYTKFMQNYDNDINKLLYQKSMDPEDPTGAKQFSKDIEKIIKSDKTIQQILKRGNNKNIKFGDFVYFKHRLTNNVKELCADDESQRDIIVGGTICDIDYNNNEVKMKYLFVMNPNYNNRCNNNTVNNSNQINYDIGVSGMPKWYVKTTTVNNRSCVSGPTNDFACEKTQWNVGTDETWVKKYIGDFTCGGGPSELGLPAKVKISSLSTNLENIINECGSNISVKNPDLPPPPPSIYNKFKEDIKLPIPKSSLPIPPPPIKTQRETLLKDIDMDFDPSKLTISKSDKKTLFTDQTNQFIDRDIFGSIGEIRYQREKETKESIPPPSEESKVAVEPKAPKVRKIGTDEDNEPANRCLVRVDNSNTERYITLIDGDSRRKVVKFYINNKGNPVRVLDNNELELPLPPDSNKNVPKAKILQRNIVRQLPESRAYNQSAYTLFAFDDNSNLYMYRELGAKDTYLGVWVKIIKKQESVEGEFAESGESSYKAISADGKDLGDVPDDYIPFNTNIRKCTA